MVMWEMLTLEIPHRNLSADEIRWNLHTINGWHPEVSARHLKTCSAIAWVQSCAKQCLAQCCRLARQLKSMLQSSQVLV